MFNWSSYRCLTLDVTGDHLLMNSETAAMKPAISFPEAHPYWSGLVLGAVTIPVPRATRAARSAMGGALARHDRGSLCGIRRARRPARREPY
ncbi:protein of unknown function [Nitrospira japonica]|uniref:Uncharacterized protein n=1 Tax=Nitrospira japonica TaxID=1325564 RepID=A0A1W1I9X5_9BACT|nr:protein of unknown function [Nitrospira japonica]